jgi:hypothetical protein
MKNGEEGGVGTHNICVDNPRRGANNMDTSLCRNSPMKYAAEFYLSVKPD